MGSSFGTDTASWWIGSDGRMQVNDLSLALPWGANKIFDVYEVARVYMVDRHA